MISICKPIEAVGRLIEKEKIRQNTDYRLSIHCVMRTTEEGVLLYHTLTCELVLLVDEEATLLRRLPAGVPESLKELALKRFLVPVDADEMKYCDQLQHIVALAGSADDAVTAYTIFTTTDCNARCFYCYEMGRSRGTMSKSTAKAVAEYIVKHSRNKPVELSWFGGEPLLNIEAIDIITHILRENGIEYTSKITTNGYLLDAELIRRAKNEWNPKYIQITLDGTEDTYNQRKAYIYQEGSAYRRVMRNIRILLDEGIPLSIRLNMDMGNSEDLHQLVRELSDKFGAYKNLYVYASTFYETPELDCYVEEDEELSREFDALTEHIDQCGLGIARGVPRSLKYSQCMADNDSSVTITPEGRLGKCEHFSETEEMYGDVRSENKDLAMIESWKETYAILPECKTCFYYPRCFRLKKCPFGIHGEECTSEFRAGIQGMLQDAMINSFEKWKAETTN